MTDLRTYSISELEANPQFGPVWVINSTKGERRGNVTLAIYRRTGIGSDTLVIPMTWVPLDLTTKVSREQLLYDNQFRQALSSGLIRLVHPEDCAKLYAENAEARAELARQQNYMSADGLGVQLDATAGTDVEVFSDQKDSGPVVIAAIADFIGKVRQAASAGELDETQTAAFCNRLRNFGELDDNTLKHIYKELKGVSPEVAAVARQLAK